MATFPTPDPDYGLPPPPMPTVPPSELPPVPDDVDHPVPINNSEQTRRHVEDYADDQPTLALSTSFR